MKNPNGYGTVVKLSGVRRNPYAVRKTVGFNEKNHPIHQTIGYYPSREEGLIALAKFNADPWDIKAGKITFSELFELWQEKKSDKLSVGNRNGLISTYRHCSSLYNMKYKSIRAYQMQECIDGCGRGYSTQATIKNLFGHLDRFAMELDIINKCYSDLLTSESIPESTKSPFTDDEVAMVWEIENDPWVDTVLVLLYTGFRIGELFAIKAADVDLTERIIKGGSKTKAGKNRIVPIHSKIMHIMEKRMREGHEYVFSHKGKQYGKSNYYKFWNPIMAKLGIDKSPHECRHTFRTRLDSAGANKVCIDLLMGHKSSDVGERIYTHKTIEELKSTIELISN